MSSEVWSAKHKVSEANLKLIHLPNKWIGQLSIAEKDYFSGRREAPFSIDLDESELKELARSLELLKLKDGLLFNAEIEYVAFGKTAKCRMSLEALIHFLLFKDMRNVRRLTIEPHKYGKYGKKKEITRT